MNRTQQEALGRLMIEGFKKGDAEIIKGCLDRGADPSVSVQDGGKGVARPAMHWAAYYFNAQCMQALVDRGADVDARAPANGETALHFATASFKADAVELLMKSGADPVAQDSNGTAVADIALGLRSDYDSYKKSRDSIIKSLATLKGKDAPAPQPAQAAPAAEEFNDTAKKGITAPKTATFAQKPKGKGFSL